jgi:cytochrome c oxidase subunit 2
LARPALVASLTALLSALQLALLATPAGATFIAPETSHSPNADHITTIYWVMLIITAILAVAINVALVMAVTRFRAKRGGAPARVRSGRGVQWKVAAALAIVAAVVFVLGVVFTEKVRTPEASGPNGLQASAALTAQAGDVPPPPSGSTAPLHINVIGQRWLWRFEYPGGRPGDRTYSYHDLYVPVDTTVILSITSTDVLHRWSVPALGGKVDAVPGQRQITWFKADEEGVYEGQSAAFSGPSYPTMRATVHVVTPQEYESYVQQKESELGEAQGIVQDTVDAEAQAAEQGSETPVGAPTAEEEAAGASGGSAEQSGGNK